MKLVELDYPVYQLRSTEKIEEAPNGYLIVTSSKGKRWILDDKSLPEKSFTRRRLKMMRKADRYEYPIYPLNVRISLLHQILKRKTKTTYIDNQGKVFNYKKGDKFYPIKPYKVDRCKEVEGLGTYFYCHNVHSPLFAPYLFKRIPKYLVLITTDTGYLLYDVTDDVGYKPTKIKL